MTDAKSLPEQVRERLDAAAIDPFVVTRKGRTEEARRGRIELREMEDGTFSIEGYASTTEVPYDVAGGAPYGFTETIARGAFKKALAERDDVRLLVNHDGVPLARTKSGTLTLAEDEVGLYVRAEGLDMSNPAVQELRSAMQRGDIDEMSFAFRATRQEWNSDYSERRITEARLFDVSVVTYPANDATAVAVIDRDADDLAEEPQALPAAGMPLGLAVAMRDAIRRSAA
jgi:HK97 family phage prohead protease